MYARYYFKHYFKHWEYRCGQGSPHEVYILAEKMGSQQVYILRDVTVTVGGSLASLAISGTVIRESLWGTGSGWAEVEIKWRIKPLEDSLES